MENKENKIKYEEDTPVQGEYRQHALSALEKLKTFHEELRKTMTEEQRKIDERMFNYYFTEGTEVKIDDTIESPKPNEFFPTDLNLYVGKKGIVKSHSADIHAFGRGWAYSMNIEFDGELVKNIPAFYMIEYGEGR